MGRAYGYSMWSFNGPWATCRPHKQKLIDCILKRSKNQLILFQVKLTRHDWILCCKFVENWSGMPHNFMLEGHERGGLTWNTMFSVNKNLPHDGAILIFGQGCIGKVENVAQPQEIPPVVQEAPCGLWDGLDGRYAILMFMRWFRYINKKVIDYHLPLVVVFSMPGVTSSIPGGMGHWGPHSLFQGCHSPPQGLQWAVRG